MQAALLFTSDMFNPLHLLVCYFYAGDQRLEHLLRGELLLWLCQLQHMPGAAGCWEGVQWRGARYGMLTRSGGSVIKT